MKNKLVFVLIFAIFLSSNFVLAEDISADDDDDDVILVKKDDVISVKKYQKNKNIKDGPKFFMGIGVEGYNDSFEWRSFRAGGSTHYDFNYGGYDIEKYEGVGFTWGIGALFNDKLEVGLNISSRSAEKEDYYTLKNNVISLENKYLFGNRESVIRPYFGIGVNYNLLEFEKYSWNEDFSAKDSFLSVSLIAGLKIYSAKNIAFDFYFKHTPQVLFELDGKCSGFNYYGNYSNSVCGSSYDAGLDTKMTLSHSGDSLGVKIMFYIQ
jgi:opacity protein-like surface antigen